MENDLKKNESISNWWFVLLIAVCILLWVVGLWGTHTYVNSHYVVKEAQDELSNPGVFGDSSGVINALFSALAFAGVIFAIILQKKELQLQREELKQTREEIEGQRHEFEQQNETLKKQRFENTFFNMLNLQQGIVKSLSLQHKDAEIVEDYSIPRGYKTVMVDHNELGINVFLFLYAKCKITYLDGFHYSGYNGLYTTIKENGAQGIDSYAYCNEVAYLDNYFKHLYRIVKFVDETTLLSNSFEERYQYTSMIRAQFSRMEYVLLFYNCLSDGGSLKFKPLVEKYSLLKGLRFDLLVNSAHEDLYSPSAYEKVSPQDN